jgi:hypothetical protein
MDSTILAALRSPTLEQQSQICEHVFGCWPNQLDTATRSEYFEYLHGELQTLRYGLRAGVVREEALAIQSFQDLIEAMRLLRENLSQPLFRIRALMKDEWNKGSSQIIDQAISLTVRLLYMLNLQTEKFPQPIVSPEDLLWKDEEALQAVIARHFPVVSLDLTTREGRLHPYFTIANMHQSCSLKIRWTNHLEDHLRLDRRTNTLPIFPYRNCLVEILKRTQQQTLST